MDPDGLLVVVICSRVTQRKSMLIMRHLPLYTN